MKAITPGPVVSVLYSIGAGGKRLRPLLLRIVEGLWIGIQRRLTFRSGRGFRDDPYRKPYSTICLPWTMMITVKGQLIIIRNSEDLAILAGHTFSRSLWDDSCRCPSCQCGSRSL